MKSVDLNTVGRQLFIQFQNQLSPKFSIEVGAFDGSFSKAMRRIVPTGNLYAFEAVPRNYDKFKKSMRGINYLNFAVTNHLGITQILIQEHAPKIAENNSLLPQANSQVKYNKVDVQATSLDYYFVESGMICEELSVCLWLDVEGATNLVLEGSKKLLTKVSSIYVEVELIEMWSGQWLADDVTSYLEKLGFVLIMRDLEGRPSQENLIFVHNLMLQRLQKKSAKLRQRLRSVFFKSVERIFKYRDRLLS